MARQNRDYALMDRTAFENMLSGWEKGMTDIEKDLLHYTGVTYEAEYKDHGEIMHDYTLYDLMEDHAQDAADAFDHLQQSGYSAKEQLNIGADKIGREFEEELQRTVAIMKSNSFAATRAKFVIGKAKENLDHLIEGIKEVSPRIKRFMNISKGCEDLERDTKLIINKVGQVVFGKEMFPDITDRSLAESLECYSIKEVNQRQNEKMNESLSKINFKIDVKEIIRRDVFENTKKKLDMDKGLKNNIVLYRMAAEMIKDYKGEYINADVLDKMVEQMKDDIPLKDIREQAMDELKRSEKEISMREHNKDKIR